jgi:hypothetical protein
MLDSNKMKKSIIVLNLIRGIYCISSCSSSQRAVNGNYTYKTECMGIEGDGSETLLAWGNGRDRFDAIEQAKKNAVIDVLFVGISNGKDVCSKRPLLPEVNAREKHERYFNSFFSDNGPYKEFVSLKDERLGDKIFRDRMKTGKSVTNSVVVRVLTSKLKEQLIKDGIK